VGTVSLSENWDSGVVVKSASERIVSSCVESSETLNNVGIAIAEAGSVISIVLWASCSNLLAVVDASVRSTNFVSVRRSVGAVNQRSRSESNLSVVQSAGKGVSREIVSDRSLNENGGADGVASSVSSSHQIRRSQKRISVVDSASGSSDRAPGIAVISANISSRGGSVWAVSVWVRKSRSSSVVKSASDGVSRSISAVSSWESSANGQTRCVIRIKRDVS